MRSIYSQPHFWLSIAGQISKAFVLKTFIKLKLLCKIYFKGGKYENINNSVILKSWKMKQFKCPQDHLNHPTTNLLIFRCFTSGTFKGRKYDPKMCSHWWQFIVSESSKLNLWNRMSLSDKNV